MNSLWLGYDGLSVPYTDIAAVLFYQPALDPRILLAYGHVPMNVRAVVITSDGRCLPSSRAADQIRLLWARWRETPE